MSRFDESALWIDCNGTPMLSVLCVPGAPSAAKVGVLIAVGGPQYRVGSHRQFTLLARHLAEAGYPVLRFDYRGMGDSDGTPRSFLEVEDDISAAADALREYTGVEQVVFWGLCDAASALLFGHWKRHRVGGLVLVNPWVRSEASLATTRLKHYYTARLSSAGFWNKLLTGQFDWRNSVKSFARSLGAAFSTGSTEATKTAGVASISYQAKMAQGLRSFNGRVLLALSGNDLTAREFLDHAATDPHWAGLLDSPRVKKVKLAEADHTFSSARWRAWLEEQTLEWLGEFDARPDVRGTEAPREPTR
jgi:exosortase A-associated hydrolase 1